MAAFRAIVMSSSRLRLGGSIGWRFYFSDHLHDSRLVLADDCVNISAQRLKSGGYSLTSFAHIPVHHNRPDEALRVLLQLPHCIALTARTLDQLACLAFSDVAKDTPQLVRCRRSFGDVQLEGLSLGMFGLMGMV